MKAFHRGFQVRHGYVRVNLGCGYVLVPGEFLDVTQIRSVFEKVGTKSVPDHVRMQPG